MDSCERELLGEIQRRGTRARQQDREQGDQEDRRPLLLSDERTEGHELFNAGHIDSDEEIEHTERELEPSRVAPMLKSTVASREAGMAYLSS